jgi:CRP-like cAMP-binding protein
MAVFVVAAADKNCIRTEALGHHRRHGALNPKLAGLITTGGHNASLSITTYNEWLAFQVGLLQQFYRNKKSIQIKMGNMFYLRQHLSKVHQPIAYAPNFNAQKSTSLDTQSLRRFIEKVQPFSENEWQAFAAIWQLFDCRRKVVLTRAGDTERHLYFVMEGVQRSFYASDEGKEATIVFTYPYSFSGVADSFLTQTPSLFHFETLTASKFLRTSHQQIFDLQQQMPAVQQLIFKLTAFALKGVLERQVEIQSFSAEEKFRKLLTRSPHVLNLIPHKYLASYLGIDAATFSKLLGSVRI